jgi:hypothetical protein
MPDQRRTQRVKRLSPKERARIKLRNGRIRRGVMWGLLCTGIAITLMAVASRWWSFGLVWGAGDGTTQRVRTLGVATWHIRYSSQRVEGAGVPPPGLHSTVRPAGTVLWTPAAGTVTDRSRGSLLFVHTLIPLGVAFLILADYEGIARRNARRGCCKSCGYKLKGLEPVDFQTTCPECGTIKKHKRPKAKRGRQPPEPVIATGS